mmetsp:Transcript_7371/g.24023  ORF Transcript_7371/g.24023 Transcript_7371/m.24023 type:complete len:224 (+) Transcript_7371:44-715(+)
MRRAPIEQRRLGALARRRRRGRRRRRRERVAVFGPAPVGPQRARAATKPPHLGAGQRAPRPARGRGRPAEAVQVQCAGFDGDAHPQATAAQRFARSREEKMARAGQAARRAVARRLRRRLPVLLVGAGRVRFRWPVCGVQRVLFAAVRLRARRAPPADAFQPHRRRRHPADVRPHLGLVEAVGARVRHSRRAAAPCARRQDRSEPRLRRFHRGPLRGLPRHAR